MNDYIVLDGNRYATNANNWMPIVEKPHTERYTLTGALDVTYGPSTPTAWEGEIVAPVTPRGGQWGSFNDLLDTLLKKEAVAFIDHNESEFTVHVLGEHNRRSAMNRWDDAQNVFYISVRLVAQ